MAEAIYMCSKKAIDLRSLAKRSAQSENSDIFHKFSAKYYHCYYKINLIPIITMFHVGHRDSVELRIMQLILRVNSYP